MPRTTSGAVQAILGKDYDADLSPDLAPFIRGANLLTTRVATCAAAKNWALSTAELAEIEAWIAAHLYTRSDKAYQSNSTDGASASYQGQTGMHMEASYYGQMAMDLDTSGCLTVLSKRQVAGGFWLGKPPSDQIDYDDRD